MQLEEYARMHKLENGYWWFVARRHLVTTLLSDLNPPRPAQILDIGCGTGAMLDQLAPFGDVVGADYSPEALSYCGQRGEKLDKEYRLVRADGRRMPFRSGSFDIVTAMDIIEHIDDDDSALSEINRVLKPGGSLIATVPAFQSLWSDHDIALHHHRRYTVPHFRSVAERAGLKIDKLSYTVSALFPFIWVYRSLHRMNKARQTGNGHISPQANLVPVTQFVNKLLLAISRGETNIVRRANLPFGVTVVAIAHKEAAPA